MSTIHSHLLAYRREYTLAYQIAVVLNQRDALGLSMILTRLLHTCAWLAALTLALWGIIHTPLWFDEGWNVLLARTWLEQGHYGALYHGQPTLGFFSASFPVIIPVAASFSLLGVDILSARMPGLFYTILMFAAGQVLFTRIFDRRTAVVGFCLCCVLASSVHLNPLFVGVQVLAEVPMLLFLFLGAIAAHRYLCTPSVRYAALALISWGVAAHLKAHFLPFFLGACAISGAVAWGRRERDSAAKLFATPLFVFGIRHGLLSFEGWLRTEELSPMRSLASHLFHEVIQLSAQVRLETLETFVLLTPWLLLCLNPRFLQNPAQGSNASAAELRTQSASMLIIALMWGFLLCWLAWYLAFSIGWIRYLNPPFVIGCFFLSHYLLEPRQSSSADLQGSTEASTLFSSSRILHPWRLALILSVVWGAVTSTVHLSHLTAHLSNRALHETVEFVHSLLPPSGVVHTYDSELFLFLDRPFEYPRQLYGEQEVKVSVLDPRYGLGQFSADSEHVVIVGTSTRRHFLFESEVAQGRLKLLRTFQAGPQKYRIYSYVPEP